MALLRRELHRSSRTPVLNDEDCWELVFDTDTKQLYVEHHWQHVDVRGPAVAESGVTRMDIATYLNQGGQTAGHRELWRLLKGIFGT
jgi:hypothetical protein